MTAQEAIADASARAARARLEPGAEALRAVLTGRWTADQAPAVEAEAGRLAGEARAAGAGPVVIDLAGVERLDTLGAWVLDRTRTELAGTGLAVSYAGARAEHAILLKEVDYPHPPLAPPPRRSPVHVFLTDVGMNVAAAGRDFLGGIAFLGEVVAACGRVALRPASFRGPAFVNQIEQVAFRGVPIIVLISFLVGGIVAQQSIYQLQRFGAGAFVVNLLGILVMRELAVLLTSIMIAGRSGSAFTAEIGSMRMREEVDALRVMGLDPIEILIVPRVLALVIGLPILAFLAAIAALVGGGLTSWMYGGITPEVFVLRLQEVVTAKHFAVGLIKAPFMALVIAVTSAIEGFAVEGSAESLGRHVTAAVVKSIFMVIVLDGIFAVFFAAIDF